MGNAEIQSTARQRQTYLQNYISMEYDDLQIGSGPTYLTVHKKAKERSPSTTQIFFSDWCTLKH